MILLRAWFCHKEEMSSKMLVGTLGKVCGIYLFNSGKRELEET